MYRACVLLVFGVSAVMAAPRAQHQGQQVGIPPHLLRQYLAEAQQQQRDSTPIYEQQGQDTQVPPRPQPHYQQQYQPQPQPQQQQYQYQPVQRLPYNAPAQQAQVVQYPQPAPAPRPQPRPAPRPLAIRPEEPENQEDYDPNPSYQFGFDVNDDQYTNYQNRKEQREGNVIKGSYSVVDSDGFIRTVTYTADPKEGFKAEVSRQPTDIVVKIPTPKPQTEQLVHRPQLQAQAQPQQYYRYQ